jgi:hypothetical protein
LEKKRFDAKRYKCAVFECDRERVSDFQVTRYGDNGEVRAARFCSVALGVTPERLLRLKGTQCGSYFFKHEKTRALNASLFTFGDADATDEEATAFANAFGAQGGMVVRHFVPSDDSRHEKSASAFRRRTDRRGRLGKKNSDSKVRRAERDAASSSGRGRNRKRRDRTRDGHVDDVERPPDDCEVGSDGFVETC